MLIDKAVGFLPQGLRQGFENIPRDELIKAEELRLRAGQSASLSVNSREIPVGEGFVTQSELETVLERATDASVHTVQSSIAQGYLNIEGGIRIGLCGTAVICDNKISGIRELSSLAIRIPHECKGCAENELMSILEDGLSDILIISPPGGGKTTCLREYIRVLSDMGNRVSVADERGELAAVKNGVPQFDIGRHSDVLSGGKKADMAMMMLKCMSPQIIAMDEISSIEDMEAVYAVSGCGVKVLATAHAGSIDELYSHKAYRDILKSSIFKYCLVIENKNGVRSYCAERLA